MEMEPRERPFPSSTVERLSSAQLIEFITALANVA